MLVLAPDVREAMVAHSCKGYPYEVCGLLVGKTAGQDFTARREAMIAIPAHNMETERKNDRYRMDPADVLKADRLARQQGLDIVGFYHSHPDHPAVASPTDLEYSSPWGGYSYPIVSVIKGDAVDLRCWYREGDAWVEEPLLQSLKKEKNHYDHTAHSNAPPRDNQSTGRD